MSRNPGIAGPHRRSVPIALALALATPWAAAPSPAQDAAKAGKAGSKEDAPRWERMDYGRSLSATIKAPAPRDNDAMKGIAIRLGPGAGTGGAVCFDTDLLRVSAGWTGGFLKLRGTPFDGSHGTWPEVEGEQVFGTRPGPGWARGDGDFKDPRPEPFGPLPADWARYKGLYRSGDGVVVSYTVGDASVLEMPGIIGEGGDDPVITRTINVGPTARPLTMVVFDVEGATGGGVGPADQPDPKAEEGPAWGHVAMLLEGDKATFAGVLDAPKGATWKVADNRHRVLLTLPASKAPAAFRVIIGRGPGGQAGLARFAGHLIPPKTSYDLSAHTRGGPSRWAGTVETRGKLGTGDGAYVVDTLTAPDDNPYRSWIRFGGMDFFADGRRAALCTWSGDVWIVSGIDDRLEKLTWRRFAAGLYQPLGLKIVDDRVYTLGRDGITRLVDLDGDGEADLYEAFNHDMAVTTSFHEFAFDLQADPEGNFYFAKAGPVRGGGQGFDTIAANSGTVMKVTRDGKTLVNYATGFRAPNGIGVGPDGQVTGGDNEGTWMPKCRLNWIRPGGFHGVVDTAHRADRPTAYDEPICWLPKDVDNSGGGQAWVTSSRWGPFGGRLLHTSYGTCSLFLALVDRKGDHVQGGVVRFPVNFLSGIMRPRFNPVDGQLYVAGLRGWQSSAAQDACFQRVRYTGRPANMVSGLKVTRAGIDLTFTDPVDADDATDPDTYEIERWNYLWCGDYGSADYSARSPNFDARVRELNRLRLDPGKNGKAIAELTRTFKKGRDEVNVESASVSGDGKTVSLAIKGLKPVMQMRIRGKLKAADGKRLNLDVINTINFVP